MFQRGQVGSGAEFERLTCRLRPSPLPDHRGAEAGKGLVGRHDDEILGQRLAREDAVERVLVRGIDPGASDHVSRRYGKRRETERDHVPVEIAEKAGVELELADPALDRDFPSRRSADENIVTRIEQQDLQGLGDAFARAEPPDQRMGVEQQPHLNSLAEPPKAAANSPSSRTERRASSLGTRSLPSRLPSPARRVRATSVGV